MKYFFFLFFVGCGSPGVTMPETCEHFGDQCRLRDGLLGVCSEDGEAQCESPPCLKCQGQH